MKMFLKVIALTSLVAVSLTLGRSSAESPQKSQLDLGENGTELKMTIRAVAPESTDSLRLNVALENVSDKDIVLNLGMILANGKVHLPDAIRLVLTDNDGVARELHFFDKRYPAIAGRVDDYVVPLRAGSAYTLKLSLKDYWCPKSREFTLELKPGRYSVRAVFIGQSAQHLNGDTARLKFMPFWTGNLKSDAVQFQVGKQG